MFSKQQLNELAGRRRLLVLESDLHRRLIGLERENLRARLAGLRPARQRRAASRPGLIVGGAMAGFLAVRHWRKVARWMPAAFTVLRWVRSLKNR